MNTGQAYIGKIVQVEPTPNADAIASVTVVCGRGGKWKGVMRKDDINTSSTVVVFLPDSLLPTNNPVFDFMKPYKHIVKQRKFRGAPSEVLILPLSSTTAEAGNDVTEEYKVEKYEKPQHEGNVMTEGLFPPFLRKTDEPNFQSVPEMVEAMRGMDVYVTLKMDGSSVTCYKYNGVFGVCSRNLQVKEGDNRYWHCVKKYELDKRLPDGIAYQFEVCGPGIQSNPSGLPSVDGFLFNVWDCNARKYISYNDIAYWTFAPIPLVKTLQIFKAYEQPQDWQEWCAELKYANGAHAEGIVVRPCIEHAAHIDREYRRFSYKVINLNYKH